MIDYLNIKEKLDEIKKINEIFLERKFLSLDMEKDYNDLLILTNNYELDFLSYYNKKKNSLDLKNKKINEGFLLSKDKNKNNIFNIIRETQNMKSELDVYEKNITDETKIKNKKLEEMKNAQVELDLREYVSNLKKLNSDKKEVKENYNNAINFLINSKNQRFEKIISENKEKILQIRETEKTEIDKINIKKISLKESEQENLIKLQEDEQYNILNFHNRNSEINEVTKKNQVDFFYYKSIYESSKKDDLNNILKIKKEDMSKFIFNKRSDDEINNLELEKFLAEYEIKEGPVKLFINEFDKIFQIYEKYYLNKYKTKLDLISLIKRFILKDIDLARTKERTTCLKKTMIEDLQIKKIENDIKAKIATQKENTDYLIRENNRLFQRQSIDQKRIKNTNLLKNEIGIEINRLNFILEKLIQEFNFSNNKKKNDNTLENIKNEIMLKESELDINLQLRINDVKKLNTNAQNNSNKLIRKNNFLFQVDIFNNIKNISNKLSNFRFDMINNLLDKFINNFNIAIDLFKKLPYLSDSYLEYLNFSKDIIDDLFKNLNTNLNNIYVYFSDYINKTIKDYIKTCSLDFLTSIKDYIKTINDRVLINSKNYEKDSKKIIIEINNFDVNIKNENTQIENLEKQILKLKKIKKEESRQTKIDYMFLLNKKIDNKNIYKLKKLELIKKGHYSEILQEKNNLILDYLNSFVKNIDIIIDNKTDKIFERFDLIVEKIKKINDFTISKFNKNLDNLKLIVSFLIAKRIDKKKTDKLFKKALSIIYNNKNIYLIYINKIDRLVNLLNYLTNSFIKKLYKIDNKNSDIIYLRFLMLSRIYRLSILENLKITRSISKKRNYITISRNINNFKTINQSQVYEKKKIKDIINKNKQKELDVIKEAAFSEKNSTQNDLAMKKKHRLDNYKNIIAIDSNTKNKRHEIVKNINDLNNEIINHNDIYKNTTIKNYQTLKKDKYYLASKLLKEQLTFENNLNDTINNINYKIRLNSENANFKIKTICDTIKKIIKERKKESQK